METLRTKNLGFIFVQYKNYRYTGTSVTREPDLQVGTIIFVVFIL